MPDTSTKETKTRSLRILYVAMEYDYGKHQNGQSFEHTNFYSSLVNAGHRVTHYDFFERASKIGKKRMREEFVTFSGSDDYDLVFLFLFTDEIDSTTIEKVREVSGAPVVNWFADDHWRFDDFTSHLGSSLDLCVTTDPDSLEKYERAGIDQVFLSQWACNQYLYKPVAISTQRRTTFVGQPHGDRRHVISRLKKFGLDTECWGAGWPNGRLTTAEMIEVFSSSAISLNLSNSSRPSRIRTTISRAMGRGGSFAKRPPQIKGRTFEIPGCGGFQLAASAPHLGRYFDIGKEIAVFNSIDDLIEQTQHWLKHPVERARIAVAGYERVLTEHTYDKRFAEIFRHLGI